MKAAVRATGVCLLWVGQSAAQPVRTGYYHGDWTSYVPIRYVTGLAQSFDLIFVGTPSGVARYHTASRRWLPTLTVSSGLDDAGIRQIAFDENYQELWVDTRLGVYSYNDVSDEWRRQLDFPAGLVRDDRATVRFDQLFTPFEITYLPPARGTSLGQFVDRELRRYPISAALNDRTNSALVYIGTWGYGLGVIDRNTQSAEFVPSGLYQERVEAILHDGPLWYFAGRGEEGEPPVISIFDTGDSTWRYNQPFYSAAAMGDITSMARLGDFVFYGTPAGLLKEDLKTHRWRKYTGFDGLPDPAVTSLLPDGRLLWVGTQKGPGLLDPYLDTGQAAISLVTPAVGTSWVYCLTRWRDYTWAGTSSGLYRISQAEGEWSRVVTESGLLKAQVRDLAQVPQGLWCATDLGLILLDSLLQAAVVYRSGVELDPGDLYSVAADAYNVWAACPAGVWRYNKVKDTFRLYTRADGLLHEFVYDIVLDGPCVWFASEGGVTRFLWDSPLRLD
jgi:ligand-binding sensor domain-containing protein